MIVRNIIVIIILSFQQPKIQQTVKTTKAYRLLSASGDSQNNRCLL